MNSHRARFLASLEMTALQHYLGIDLLAGRLRGGDDRDGYQAQTINLVAASSQSGLPSAIVAPKSPQTRSRIPHQCSKTGL
jgi:hypothetical protein